MAKVKNTKNELKAQRDSLRRYERYLPTLQLKKQQLQLEVRQVEQRLEECRQREERRVADMANWVALFGDGTAFAEWISIRQIVRDETNVAGVNIPVLREIVFERHAPDLWDTPPWIDDGIDALAELARLRIERRVLEEQRELLVDELRTTNQRVNLFERVKIPECRDAIRKIRISLGDIQVLEVARGKIAKQKSLERETGS
jgi:V/A-type H+-transporting ATPase subunit D